MVDRSEILNNLNKDLSEAIQKILNKHLTENGDEGTIDGNSAVTVFEALQASLISNLSHALAAQASIVNLGSSGKIQKNEEILTQLGAAILDLSTGVDAYLTGRLKWPHFNTFVYN